MNMDKAIRKTENRFRKDKQRRNVALSCFGAGSALIGAGTVWGLLNLLCMYRILPDQYFFLIGFVLTIGMIFSNLMTWTLRGMQRRELYDVLEDDTPGALRRLRDEIELEMAQQENEK
jgi:hypothetical protein